MGESPLRHVDLFISVPWINLWWNLEDSGIHQWISTHLLMMNHINWAGDFHHEPLQNKPRLYQLEHNDQCETTTTVFTVSFLPSLLPSLSFSLALRTLSLVVISTRSSSHCDSCLSLHPLCDHGRSFDPCIHCPPRPLLLMNTNYGSIHSLGTKCNCFPQPLFITSSFRMTSTAHSVRLIAILFLLAVAVNWQYGFSSTYLNTPVDQFKVRLFNQLDRFDKSCRNISMNL